jgi:Tetratricopeptide repeat
LQLYIDFNDPYEQASTYHHLGMVAAEQRQWAQAREYFLRALEVFVFSEDTYSGIIVLRNLARLWQSSLEGAAMSQGHVHTDTDHRTLIGPAGVGDRSLGASSPTTIDQREAKPEYG